MNSKTNRYVLCYRLGIPLFSVSKPCSACSKVFAEEIYGDHVVSYAGIVGIKHRHNVLRDTLVDICFRSGISAGKEVDIGLDGGVTNHYVQQICYFTRGMEPLDMGFFPFLYLFGEIRGGRGYIVEVDLEILHGLGHRSTLSLHAWYLDDGTIVGDTMVVRKVLELIMEDGPGCGLHLNVDKTEVFLPKEDPRSRLAERIVTDSGPGFGDWQWRLATLPFACGGLGVYSAGDTALWTSQREDHTSDWLQTVPISGLGQTMNACLRVFAGDIYGDHDVSCVGIIGIKDRHNVVRDTLVDICYRSRILAGKKVDIGLDGRRDKPLRLADMLLYLWDGGLDVCVDLTESSPLTQTRMVDFVPSRAVIDDAQRKREADAVTLLKRIRKFSMTQDIGARAAAHIFNRISFAIAKGMALWQSQMEDHTSDWLRVVPISGLGQTMNGKTYRCVLCYRLGVPLFSVSKPCSACSKVFTGDIYGDHAVSCAGIIGIKHRHNVVRDTLVDICFRSGISAGKEVDIGLGGGCDKPLRPADMLLYSWDKGLDVCVDLTGSSPLTQTGMVDFVPGRAVIDAAHRKRVKYEAKCANIGYGFLPFSFSSLGELEKDAVTLLKRIRKFSVTQDIGARAAIHIFNRISFAIAKGVGAQLVSRLPTNFFKEVDIGLGGGRDKPLRPADILLYSWDEGRDTAQHKCVKYEAKCADIGYGFLPFSFSSFEELDKGAISLQSESSRIRETKWDNFEIDVHLAGEKVALGVIKTVKINLANDIFTKDQYVTQLVIAASAYYIWQERNWRLFKNSKRKPIQICECIQSSVRLKLLSCKLKKSKNGERMARLWELPEAVFL
ncbi:hypothetical protein Tco_1154047 [Tanacetum coccineum]